jgi:ATP-binding cassette subfamily B protein
MKNNFGFIYKYIKEEKFKIFLAFIIIIISSLLNLTYGYFNGAAVEAISNLNLKMSLIYLGLYFIVSIFSATFLTQLGYYILNKLKIKLINKINLETYKKILNLPAKAFEEIKSGEIINRVTNDAETIADSFKRLLDITTALLGSIIIFIYIIFNSWIIALEIIIFVIILSFITNYFNPKMKEINENVKKVNDNYTSEVSETIRGIREIKTLGIKDNLFNEIKELIEKLFNNKKEELKLDTKYDICMDLFRIFLEVGVFVSCAILLYYSKATLTFFIAMTYYVYRYTWLVSSFSDFSKTYQKAKVAIKRINEILDNKLYKDEQFGKIKLDNSLKTIEFKNVTFGYKDNELTLKNFNIKLEPNKKIAIVGKSGQGKSTLFNLMTRIFDVTEGNIYINDINIKDILEKSLRDNISIIRQDPFIFNRTIKENFLILNKNLTLAEIKEYCKKAYLDEYIESLPNKYETLIGEGGINLSGGQKQRLAIARTLAKKSTVILFDEATSALDNQSQSYIKKSIDNLVKDHTIIIIAHRLSTIIDADIIYVIDDGKVIDSGTHEELLKKCKYYQDLYKIEN